MDGFSAIQRNNIHTILYDMNELKNIGKLMILLAKCRVTLFDLRLPTPKPRPAIWQKNQQIEQCWHLLQGDVEFLPKKPKR